jgi:hypothetical protein
MIDYTKIVSELDLLGTQTAGGIEITDGLEWSGVTYINIQEEKEYIDNIIRSNCTGDIYLFSELIDNRYKAMINQIDPNSQK